MKKGRPRKIRMVQKEPKTRQFSPRGRIGRPGNMELKYEEFEAIRLSDYLGMRQSEAADFMKISQQTFSRVIRAGRKHVAEALVKGLIIKVGGGDFRIIKH